MFDLLIQQVATKFGLGSKASWVLSALLGFMFNRNTGGLSGFLGKLTNDGLGKIVNSWVGKDEPMAINSTQVKSAIGSGLIDSLSSKLGLPSGPIGQAIAYMLPKTVSALTPDGVIPESIPSAFAHYINDEDQAVAITVPEPEVERSYIAEDDTESSGFNWWWLLLLPLLLSLGYCTLKPDTPTVIEPVAPAPVIQSINPRLSISNDADVFNITGTVADNATKDSIMGTLTNILGLDKVKGDIVIDPAAKDAGWLSNLAEIVSALRATPGARVDFDGSNIVLGGNMEQGIIDSLMEKLKGLFGTDGFNISSQAIVPQVIETISAPIETVQELAADGNEALQNMVDSGTVSSEDLIAALNVASINFSTGSSNIASGSLAVLRTAGEAIKLAPAGTRIEVGGHTDNTGASQINARISKQRAQSVADALASMGVDASILSVKGYGDSQPIADNSTQEGRSQNRRMEFSLR